ncbi:CAT RNA binding domain-containing protein [Ligilactobacillus acidipiscis]|uniref:CAT RNA binding domain-containing protein n=1 Tax=Ligilactobacillus acidipiscis TaxID=89059 RepID=UPI0038691FA9
MLGIVQVLNNNCAIVDLGKGRQALVKGRGGAYQKRKGDQLDNERIEKVMYLATKESQQNLAFLLKDIPINIVTTTYETVDNAKSKYHYNLADFVYVTLADHINPELFILFVLNKIWRKITLVSEKSFFC